jgi:hypothetical protein
MSTPETKARTGDDRSPAEVLQTAMAGFMSDFRAFSTDIHQKLQEQDKRMSKLDRKSAIAGARPALATAASEEAPHSTWKARPCPAPWPPMVATLSIRRPRT